METGESVVKKEIKAGPQFDVVVVLGGNIREVAPGKFKSTSFVEGPEKSIGGHSRTLAAAELYKKGISKNFLVSTGQTMVDELGIVDPTKPTESEVMMQEMVRYGIPPENIEKEEISTTTQTNAIEVMKILRERGYRKVGFLTSFWHLERSMEFFKTQHPEMDGIEITPLSSEDVIAQKSERHARIVDVVKNTSTMEERMANEKRGVDLLKSGKYISKPLGQK